MPLQPVSITLTVTLPGAPDEVFDAVTAEDVLPKVLTGYGPLPAVVGTRNLSGPWDQPGSRRTVVLADGATATEEVTGQARPHGFDYRVYGFTNLLRHLVAEARGSWRFSAVPGGTEARWTYSFTPRGAASRMVLAGGIQPLWRGYMQVCLESFEAMLRPA